MPNTYFQKRLRELRIGKRLTMQELADKMDVTKSRVNMWENNGTVPRMNVLIKLANYFGVTTDYLLGNDDTSGISPQNQKLNLLQRNLGKLNAEELEKAEGMLRAVFTDIFDSEDDENDYI
ncbi:MAG: helix-turn-helix domain-containing protein [Selenomonadaceae bacterium]|nr:helix-turn-helix domain-containing protein [Selenomonadaceae bacterium]